MTYRFPVVVALYFLCVISCSIFSVNAQSNSVEYPTAVPTNEINGKIPARDLGDARLTSYYYTFNGSLGDIFINVSASNFNGDIDIFIAEGLRPLTKISFYADSLVTETGRVIYLRKPEKLILRVEGRTPDDNPASFQIKFAGSFLAVQDNGRNEEPLIPQVKSEDTGGIRVNSVGTIIKPVLKTTPEIINKIAENTEAEKSETQKTEESVSKTVIEETTEPLKNDEAEKSVENKNEPEKKTVIAPKKRTTARNAKNNPRRTASARTPVKAEPENKSTAKEAEKPTAEAKVNPLENVRLIVLMKNGDKIEFPMTDVFRFSLSNNVLTIITKDGKIHRRSILDIQKMTVE